ncbi:hypothetical protein WJX72_010920 [[Myrmecia] bisecta]|uniref:Uncharacterized protein n=1 Tax=[Myrmecia] bisecta TaxID=41462 RepID=A0AAW1PKQ6_9CHLO
MAANATATKNANMSSAVRPGPSSAKAPPSVPLAAVVTEAVRRWYLETHKEAVKGDVKMQALLGQMLIDGYGCEADPVAGKEWVDKARRRGYRMSGTYDEL